MKLLKLENLVVAVYLLILGLTFALMDRAVLPEKRGSLILIGLAGMAPFILFFRVWQRMGPSSSWFFLVVHAVVIALLFVPGLELVSILPVFLLFAAIYGAQRESAQTYERWLTRSDFSCVQQPPALIWEKLNAACHWRCFASAFSLSDGRKVPFLFWSGWSSNPGGKGQITYIAFSFSRQDVSEKFIQGLDALKRDHLTAFQRLKPSNQARCSYLSERLPDGSYVAAWANPHRVSIVEERLQRLRDLLEDSAGEQPFQEKLC